MNRIHATDPWMPTLQVVCGDSLAGDIQTLHRARGEQNRRWR
ncbi:hypothetical protein [Xanthomonas arboricola]|nr:hypothetical protein [Xanthomonas arboricola]MBB3848792.1 hypothetical protein [Xanthomonas arboricola]